MKRRLLIYLCLIYCGTGYAQSTARFSYYIPNWDKIDYSNVKPGIVKSMSVYVYKKPKNNHDSMLVMTQYYDSAGCIIERDEFDLDGSPFKITNFIYQGKLLLKRESIERGILVTDNYLFSKKVITYTYDSLGHVLTEKQATYSRDTLHASVTVWDREYDNAGHLAKEFLTLPERTPFLYHTYSYTNGRLNEIKTFDYTRKCIYSYVHQYNNEEKINTVYLNNGTSILEEQVIYDNQGRVIQQKFYGWRIVTDHSTHNYSYGPDGLLESQSFKDLNGKNYYYKHFYSR